MDILKRNMAPLADVAWEAIDERAEQVLKNILTARKAVKVDGPKGLDFTQISEGRLDLIEDASVVKAGIYKVKPLVEARVRFSLKKWELDNITRGAKDIDLEALEKAVAELAYFEEKAVYKGYSAGDIRGLKEASAHDAIAFGESGSAIMEAITKGTLLLKDFFVSGPYVLILGKEAFTRISRDVQGYPLIQRIQNLIQGQILISDAVDGGFLMPFNHEDLELTVGQDFAIGYESSDHESVNLFMTESFTFRVLDENIIVPFKL